MSLSSNFFLNGSPRGEVSQEESFLPAEVLVVRVFTPTLPARMTNHKPASAGFIFPFVLTALLDKVGLRWTLRIWAIVTTIFCGIALLGLRPRLPVPKYPHGSRRPRFIPPQLGFVKTPLFWSVVRCPIRCLSFYPFVNLYPYFSVADYPFARLLLFPCLTVYREFHDCARFPLDSHYCAISFQLLRSCWSALAWPP